MNRRRFLQALALSFLYGAGTLHCQESASRLTRIIEITVVSGWTGFCGALLTCGAVCALYDSCTSLKKLYNFDTYYSLYKPILSGGRRGMKRARKIARDDCAIANYASQLIRIKKDLHSGVWKSATATFILGALSIIMVHDTFAAVKDLQQILKSR